MIPKEIIEEVRNKADIVQIVSEYVPIRKRGKNYLGSCPFHSEKEPSFTVSPEKQIFHCFGCNEGGNVFAFLMKIENINFAEAVEELGIKLGIAVPKASPSGTSKTDKDKLYQVMLLAAKFFQSQLPGSAALQYLEKRGIKEATSQHFGLGFAPLGWDNLFKHLVSRGVAPKLIEQSGLILKRESQEGYYDRFRNRLIFPVADQRGKVIAFGGRALGDEEPKYLNSPDTPIYHKGKTLFGLSQALDAIKKSRTAVLVEGYFDLITPFQAGVTNMIASCGTALTIDQCKLLARYCDTMVLAYDADTAGGIAAERSVELLRNQGLKVKVATLSGGKDPDEIIVKHGADAFKEIIASAQPFLEWKMRRITTRDDMRDIESRSRALRAIAQLLVEEKDAFVQNEYAKLAATLLKTDADTVQAEIKRSRHYPTGSRSSQSRVTTKPNSKVAEAEKNLVILAVQNKEVLEALKKELSLEDFLMPETRAIAELLFTSEENSAHFLLENLPSEEARNFLSRNLLCEHLLAGQNTDQIVADCVNVIRGRHQDNRIEALKAQLKEAEHMGQNDKVAELLSALKSEIS